MTALLRAAHQACTLFPDPSDPGAEDVDAAFDADELYLIVIGGVRDGVLIPEARDGACRLAADLAERDSTSADQRAALLSLAEILRTW